MTAVTKITVSYDEHEDRLLLAAASETDQRVFALWLTQRLSNRLVAHVLRWLDEGVAGSNPATRDAMHSWEQEAARACLPHTAPVHAAQDQIEGRIESIDLTRGDGRSQLAFRWAQDQIVTFSLDDTTLRQWLGMLHGLYVKAQWPVAHVWPDWFGQTQKQQAPRAHASLH